MTTVKKLKFSGLGSEAVDPEELLQFLLPSGFFHSKSTARLYIFAEFGPVLVKVREGWMSLRSGYKGQHVVTEQELEDMIVDMIREDILKVYVGDAVLKPTEQEEVISQADNKLKSIPNYTKEEIEELLAPALNKDLQYDFHKLQHIVRRERHVQLKERKKMYPDVVGPRLPKKAFQFYEEGLQQSIRPKKFRDSEIFMYTSKALSRNSFRVAEQEDKSNPALVVNSRFLREDPPFNPAIPMLKVPVIKGKGSYVKPHQTWKSQFFPPSELRLGQPRRR